MKYLALQQRCQGKYRLRNDLLGAWDFFKATDGCYGVTCHAMTQLKAVSEQGPNTEWPQLELLSKLPSSPKVILFPFIYFFNHLAVKFNISN